MIVDLLADFELPFILKLAAILDFIAILNFVFILDLVSILIMAFFYFLLILSLSFSICGSTDLSKVV